MDERPDITGAPADKAARFPKSVLFASVGIVALVVIALVIALALPNRPTEYPAGSPEAAFQDFYGAWETNDLEAAYGHFSPAVTKDLSLSEYRRMNSDWSWQRDQDRRLVLLGADVTGDRAVLHVRVDEFTEGALGGQRNSFERPVRLALENGAWLIDEPLIGIESVGYGY
jgi:hypothetical protein